MKKITLLWAFAFISLTTVAQIASENFDDGMTPDGWTLTTVTGDCDWAFTEFTPSSQDDFTSIAIVYDDDACGSGAPASNLEVLSAVYDLSALTADLTLTYDVWFQEFGAQTFDVEYFDGNDWVNIITYEADTQTVISETFTISGVSNSDFQVRFTYDDNNGEWGWGAGIDNFVLDETLSTNDNSVTEFKIFPNPANNLLNVSAGSSIEGVTIFNMLGQKVLEEQVGATSAQLDIARLQTGAYLMQVTVDGQLGTYKFVKQ